MTTTVYKFFNPEWAAMAAAMARIDLPALARKAREITE